jgi:two-component system, cell cycle response regulator DivK
MTGKGADRLILIVEDNDKNLKLTRDVLQFHGFRTAEVTNGEDAVALAGEILPDLILMDVALPGIDGVEAARRLKANPATAAMPIVALTASVMQADRARFEVAGFAGIIAKPIDVRTFPDQILEYCKPPSQEP